MEIQNEIDQNITIKYQKVSDNIEDINIENETYNQQEEENRMIKENKQSIPRLLFDIWNKIPLIRHILNTLIISLQILSGIVVPGFLTFINILCVIIESFAFIFTDISFVRGMSIFQGIYSLILSIVYVIAMVVNDKEHLLLNAFGLSCQYTEPWQMITEIVSNIALVILCIVSVFTKGQVFPIEKFIGKKRLENVKERKRAITIVKNVSLVCVFVAVATLQVISSSIFPLVFFGCALILWIFRGKAFYVLSILFLVIYIPMIVANVIAYPSYIIAVNNKSVEDVNTISVYFLAVSWYFGFHYLTPQQSNFFTTGSYFGMIAFYAIICALMKVMKRLLYPPKTIDVIFEGVQTQSDDEVIQINENDNSEERLEKEKKLKQRRRKEKAKKVGDIFKIIFKMLLSSTIYVSLGLIYWISNKFENEMSMYASIFACILFFLNPKSSRKVWSNFTIIIAIGVVISSLTYYDVYFKLETYTCDYSQMTEDECKNQINKLGLEFEIYREVFLCGIYVLIIMVVQMFINIFNDLFDVETTFYLKMKYMFALFFNRWMVSITCLVVGICCLEETLNIDMIVILLVLSSYLFYQLHFNRNNTALKVVGILSLIFLLLFLIIRFVFQYAYRIEQMESEFNLFEDSLSNNSSSHIPTSFEELVNSFKSSESLIYWFGLNIEEIKKSFLEMYLPHMVTFIAVGFMTRCIFKLPSYLTELKLKIEERDDVQRQIHLEKQKYNKDESLNKEDNQMQIVDNVKIDVTADDNFVFIDKDFGTGRDFSLNRKVQEIYEFIMKFLYLYMPHVTMIVCCYYVFKPLIYTEDGTKSFNLFHFIMLIPIVFSVAFADKGFAKVIKLMYWIVSIVITLLYFFNIPLVDHIMQNLLTPEQKSTLYNVFGFATCNNSPYIYEYEVIENGQTIVKTKCDVIQDEVFDTPSYFPDTKILFSNLIQLLIFLSINQTIQQWGKQYEQHHRGETITLFKYKQYSEEGGKKTLNRLKRSLSHFFELYGDYIVHIISIICAYFHSSDVICLIQIAFQLFMMYLPKKRKLMMFIFEWIFVVALLINVFFMIPFKGTSQTPSSSMQPSTNNDMFSWDYKHTFMEYILFYSENHGVELVFARVFDVLLIFALKRFRFYYKEKQEHKDDEDAFIINDDEISQSIKLEEQNEKGDKTTIQKIDNVLLSDNFPSEGGNVFDRIMLFILKYLNLLTIFIVIAFALNRQDLLGISYFITMVVFLVKKPSQKSWRILQYTTILLLVLQNIFVLMNCLNRFKSDDPNDKAKDTFVTAVMKILEIIGLRDINETDFISNYIIFFIVWLRQSLAKEYENELTEINQIYSKTYLKQLEKIKRLVDLDTNDQLIELENNYNSRVDRKMRLEELRAKKKKIENNSQEEEIKVEINENNIKEEEKEKKDDDNSEESSSDDEEENKTNEQPEGVVESFKMIFFMFVDKIISSLNHRNIALRLGLHKKATEEEIDEAFNERMKEKKNILENNIPFESTNKSIEENEINKSNQKYEFIQTHQFKQPKYKKRLNKFFWGLGFYLSEQTEVLVLLGFILNYLFNQNILSAFYPICGFIVVLLSSRPYPKKNMWKRIIIFFMLVICLRMIFQFPGWCLTANSAREFDYISISYQDRYEENSRIKCSTSSLSGNKLSFIYVFGIYPVDIYIFSSFIWDVICLFLIHVHIQYMEQSGYWDEEYLIKKSLSETIVENYKRQLHNKIEPNSFTERYCIVKAKKTIEEPTENYIAFHKNDLFIVRQMLPNGDLVVETKESLKPQQKQQNLFELMGIEQPQEDEEQLKLIKSENVEFYSLPIRKIEKEELDENEEDSDDSSEEFEKRLVSVDKETKKKMKKERKKIKKERKQQKKLEKKQQKLENKRRKYNYTKDEFYDEMEYRENKLKEREKENELKNRIQKHFINLWYNLKLYFAQLIRNDNKEGKDYYLLQIVVEALSAVWLVIFSPVFIDSDALFIDYFMKDNILPGTYVFGVLLQVGFIIVDHIVYVLKSLKAKVILHYISIILYHALIVVFYPLKGKQTGFFAIFCLVVFYILKVIYWSISSFQIRSGYVVLSSFNLLKSGYTFIHSLAFKIWYSIPYVYEIKTILEWVFVKTSITYRNWLKIEDIQHQLFTNQCLSQQEKEKKRKIGTKRTVMEKLTGGGIIVCLMLILLAAPLIIMSSVFPVFKSVEPKAFEIQVTVGESGEIFSQYRTKRVPLNNDDVNKKFSSNVNDGKTIRLDGSQTFYEMTIPLHSLHYWSISPYNRESFTQTVCSNQTQDVLLEMNIKMSREDSSAANEFEYHFDRKLSFEEQQGFCNLLTGQPLDENFRMELFPQYFKMPTLKETELIELGKEKERIKVYPNLRTDATMGLSYWYFTMNNETNMPIYIVSPEVPQNIFLISKITEMGILTIYTAIIFVAYGFLKTDYSGISQRIMYENMPNCLGLLQLYDDITLARQDDDLALEEELANELLEIYRLPEVLFEKSKK